MLAFGQANIDAQAMRSQPFDIGQSADIGGEPLEPSRVTESSINVS
jgi:hypothetical protein